MPLTTPIWKSTCLNLGTRGGLTSPFWISLTSEYAGSLGLCWAIIPLCCRIFVISVHNPQIYSISSLLQTACISCLQLPELRVAAAGFVTSGTFPSRLHMWRAYTQLAVYGIPRWALIHVWCCVMWWSWRHVLSILHGCSKQEYTALALNSFKVLFG